MAKRRIRDPRNPQLFSNEQLGLPPDDYEFREVIKTDENGRIIRQRIAVKTKDAFVRQARKIWGDQYDYTDSVYTGNKDPITIYCPKHDYHFTVPLAQNHLVKPGSKISPTGCPYCTQEKIGFMPGNTKFMTDEQRERNERKQREKEEAKRRKEERERRKALGLVSKKDPREREKQKKEEEDFIRKWNAKDLLEARFKERVFQKYGDDLDTSLVDYQGREVPVTLICRHHGIFEITPRILFSGSKSTPPHGCWKCSGLQDPAERFVLTAKKFNQRVQKLYMLKGLTFPLKRKIKPTDKITAVCRKHGEITHDAMWWYHGNGCEYCNGKWYAPHWKDYARRVHGDKYEYVGDAPVKQTDYIHYICPTHGLQEQEYRVHVGLGCGCPQCANYPNKKSPMERCQEWIAKCIEKYGEGRYDYSRAHEDYVNNDSLVWIRCCIHNKWFQTTPDNNLRTVNGSCPICSADFTETQGEAEIRRWLLKHDIINFKQDEVTLPNENPRCKRQYLRPDFWLPDYNLFIEYNGEQHYEDVDYFFDEDFTFEDQQIRDQTLRDYCQRHGHSLLEIPYWDFKRIDEILTNELLNVNT